jgi:hypothetical protein
MNINDFDINRSYWIVSGETSRVWSVPDGRYVTEWPEGIFLARAGSELDLSNLLRGSGLPGPVEPDPTDKERLEAAETIIDLLLMEGE